MIQGDGGMPLDLSDCVRGHKTCLSIYHEPKQRKQERNGGNRDVKRG